MRLLATAFCYLSLLTFLPASALANSDTSKAVIARAASVGIELELHPDAKGELLEHANVCGVGVVKGWPGENRCGYQIVLDDWFLKPIHEKTGLLHDPEWAYQPGVQWISASEKEMDEVPEAWDLSEVGPMTDIHRQQCGDCWSTSSRKLLEQALATHGEVTDEGELFQLSEQTTLSSCCTWCGSCSGGYMSTPNFFSKEGGNAYSYGLPTRDLDPYRGTNSSCRFSTSELRSFEHKLISAPYVGSSLSHSRYFRPEDQNGPKVENIMANMIKYKSNSLVTIQAISQSGGIITSCSAVNAGGNHMQNIVGWYQSNGYTVARVQNSWGTDHGQDGYTHLRWECGEGQFNRGLGRSARIGIYKVEGQCKSLPEAYAGPDITFVKTGKGIVIGKPSTNEQTCRWLPESGVEEVLSADGCQVRVNPEVTTEYHVIATDPCGTEMSSMVLITPVDPSDGKPLSGSKILTPHGIAQQH